MTVLNIEYYNEFETLPILLQIVLVLAVPILFTFIICCSIFIFTDNDKEFVLPTIISSIVLIAIIAFLCKKYFQKSKYIEYKEVLINDDYKWETETIQNWEIDSKRGDIYILKPKDRQMIQEDQ